MNDIQNTDNRLFLTGDAGQLVYSPDANPKPYMVYRSDRLATLYTDILMGT